MFFFWYSFPSLPFSIPERNETQQKDGKVYSTMYCNILIQNTLMAPFLFSFLERTENIDRKLDEVNANQ
jgi:hypothetical protein